MEEDYLFLLFSGGYRREPPPVVWELRTSSLLLFYGKREPPSLRWKKITFFFLMEEGYLLFLYNGIPSLSTTIEEKKKDPLHLFDGRRRPSPALP